MCWRRDVGGGICRRISRHAVLVWDYFDLWSYDGTPDRIHGVLYVAMREAEGRETSPTAAAAARRSRRKKGA